MDNADPVDQPVEEVTTVIEDHGANPVTAEDSAPAENSADAHPVADLPEETPVTEEPTLVAEQPAAADPVAADVPPPVEEQPVTEEHPETEQELATEHPKLETFVEEQPSPVDETAPEESTAVDIPSGQPEATKEEAASPEPSPSKPAAPKPKKTTSPSSKSQPNNSNTSASRSPGRSGALITKQAMMDEHASLCSQRAQHNKERDAHRVHATNAIRTLASANKQDDHTIKSALEAMEEEDKTMFSKIPADLMPRKAKKQEDRALTAARSQQFRNANYHAPPRATPEDPRTIVDIKRPIAPRNAPIPPNPSVTGQSRYAGLSQGNFTALEQDPHYKLDAEHNPRKEIEKKKEAIIKSFCPPHSPEALKKKNGYVFQEKATTKVPKDYIPAVAQKLPDGHGDDARERRDRAEKGYSVVAFKC